MNTGRIVDRIAKSRKSGLGGILVVSNDVEVIFNPWDRFIQIGMGGEWWSDEVKVGRTVIIHRKGRVDPGYAPVIVDIKETSKGYQFDISGGFGNKATVNMIMR